jgi:hypothetical protein
VGRRLGFLAAVVAAAVIAGAASAAPQTRSADVHVWATHVCTSLKTWQHSLQRRSKAVSATKPSSIGELHDRFAAFLVAVVKDTDTLIGRTKAAGTPSVSNGAAIEKALVTGFTKLRTYFAADAVKAKHLSRTDASQFAAGAAAIGDLIDRQASKVTSTFDALDKKYRSTSLDKVMRGTSACKGIG